MTCTMDEVCVCGGCVERARPRHPTAGERLADDLQVIALELAHLPDWPERRAIERAVLRARGNLRSLRAENRRLEERLEERTEPLLRASVELERLRRGAA